MIHLCTGSQTLTLENTCGELGVAATLPHKLLMVKQLSLKEAPYHRQVFIILSCIYNPRNIKTSPGLVKGTTSLTGPFPSGWAHMGARGLQTTSLSSEQVPYKNRSVEGSQRTISLHYAGTCAGLWPGTPQDSGTSLLRGGKIYPGHRSPSNTARGTLCRTAGGQEGTLTFRE